MDEDDEVLVEFFIPEIDDNTDVRLFFLLFFVKVKENTLMYERILKYFHIFSSIRYTIRISTQNRFDSISHVRSVAIRYVNSIC